MLSTKPTHHRVLLDPFELGNWSTQGACRKHPTALWFAVRAPEIAQAKRICEGCPVRAECLEHALARPTLLGIWAGTTPVERSAMRVRDNVATPAARSM